MRFKKFLEAGWGQARSYSSDPEERDPALDDEALVEQLKKDFAGERARIAESCGPFMSALKTGNAELLFRGIKGEYNVPIVNQMPKDREPKDSNISWNNLFNKAIEEAHGVVDVRKRTVFCTPNWAVAKEYGSVYAVFPKGHFSIMACKDIEDSWVDADNLDNHLAQHLFKTNVLTKNARLKTADEPEGDDIDDDGKGLSFVRLKNTIFLAADISMDELYKRVAALAKGYRLCNDDPEVIKKSIDGFLKEWGKDYTVEHDHLPGNGDWQVEYLLYQADGYIAVSLSEAVGTYTDVSPAKLHLLIKDALISS